MSVTDGQSDRRHRRKCRTSLLCVAKSKGKFTSVRTADVSCKPVVCDATVRQQCSSGGGKYDQPADSVERVRVDVNSDAVYRINAFRLTLAQRQSTLYAIRRSGVGECLPRARQKRYAQHHYFTVTITVII